LRNLIDEHFKSDLEAAMKDPILFGDYRTALNESEPKVYEDIQDYEAAKAMFQVLSRAQHGPQTCVCVSCMSG